MGSRWQRHLEGSQFENERWAPVILSQEQRKKGESFILFHYQDSNLSEYSILIEYSIIILYNCVLNSCMKLNEEAQRREKPTLRNYQVEETTPEIHCGFTLKQRSSNIGT